MIQVGVWKHYKGGYYQVLGVAAHSETNELMVVYVSLTGAHLPGPRMRVRPLFQWNSFVRGPGDDSLPRYEYVGLEIPTPETQPLKSIGGGHNTDGISGR